MFNRILQQSCKIVDLFVQNKDLNFFCFHWHSNDVVNKDYCTRQLAIQPRMVKSLSDINHENIN